MPAGRFSLVASRRSGSVFSLRKFLIPVLALLVTSLPAVSSADQNTEKKPNGFTEFELKALFLYRFGDFVDWPALSGPSLNLCVLGQDPFGSLLDYFEKKPVKNGTLRIQRPHSLDSIVSCHILFVSRSEKKNAERILSVARQHAILTVSELEGFTCSGGVARLFVLKDRVSLEVNLDAAKHSGLEIDSKLLGLARISDPSSCPGRDQP